MLLQPQPKLGIIAGGGTLPSQLIEACRSAGRQYYVLAILGHADNTNWPEDTPHSWIRLGEAGRAFSILHEHEVKDIVLAGPVRRPTVWELRPDWQTIRFFSRIGFKALGDDGLLRAVIREIENEGFRVVGLHTVLKDVFAVSGVLGHIKPDEQAIADITHGIHVLKTMAPLDVGQGVVVQHGLIIGIEAIEGTDALLTRCGPLQRQGLGGVFIKMRKQGQEERVDLPTVGPQTVKNAVASGLRGIAIEAGGVLMVDRVDMIETAQKAGVFLYAFDAQQPVVGESLSADLSDCR